VEDEINDQGEYFDVYSNIESFTNYNGTSIWHLIYSENCFQSSSFQELCSDEQILYNIISGLHTSISTHLSRFYKNPTPQQAVWADLRTEGHAQFHFNHS
jgi:trehalose-6-phosphatase